jgi:hypothetical protein
MADIPLVNETDRKFIDISHEKVRIYSWGRNKEIRIENPQWLSIGARGHRVVDGTGKAHFIQNGWLEVSWEPKEGAPQFKE